MRSVIFRQQLQTTADTQVINITDQVHAAVTESGIKDGVALILTMHTTSAITVNEGLEDIEDDLLELLKDIVPVSRRYRHARFLDSDGQMAVNAPSHLRGALFGMETLFPIENGALVIGARQTIYFVELDGPLQREWIVQVLGV